MIKLAWVGLGFLVQDNSSTLNIQELGKCTWSITNGNIIHGYIDHAHSTTKPEYIHQFYLLFTPPSFSNASIHRTQGDIIGVHIVS